MSSKEVPPKKSSSGDNYQGLDTRLTLAMSSLLLMTFLVALDGTTVSVALDIITTSLKGTSVEGFWIGTSYLLCSTAFQPIYASMSGCVGRKPMILLALVFFGVGSILGGAAPSMAAMLTGRCFQGVGGAGLIAMTEVVLTDLIPLRQRGTYTGVVGSMYALGGGIGPIVGGALAQADWRWIFWLNLPLVGIAMMVTIFFLPLQRLQNRSSRLLTEFDWLGAVIFVGSTVSFLIPVSWGGVQEPWQSWKTMFPLCAGILGMAAFAVYNFRFSSCPLLPIDVFANWSTNAGYLGSILQGVILYTLLYFLPLYLQVAKEFSPLTTGIALLPLTLGITPAAAVTGVLISKLSRYRWSLWLSWTITIVGIGLLLLIKVDTSIAAFCVILLVGAIGTGVGAPAIQFAVQASQPTQKTAGLALSVFSYARSFGQTIGVAAGSNIVQNEFARRLNQIPALADRAGEFSMATSALSQIVKEFLVGTEKMALKTAYVDALSTVWIFDIALSAAALLLSLTIRAYSMDKALDTDQGMLRAQSEGPPSSPDEV